MLFCWMATLAIAVPQDSIQQEKKTKKDREMGWLKRTLRGFTYIDENYVSKPYVLHAEANAITKLARSNNNSDGATIYITASPCIECAKLIIQSGIRRVVYGEKYRLTDGIELLQRAGIEVVYLEV